MKTLKQTITPSKVRFWYFLVNAPMVALAILVHYLIMKVGGFHGDNFMEEFGLWLLVAFKIIGANLILAVIFSDFKIIRS